MDRYLKASRLMNFNGFSNLGLMAIFLIVGSSNPVAIKYALNHGWPPFILGLFRMIFIGVFFGAWIWFIRENPIGSSRQVRFYTIAASFCKGAGAICYYIAFSLIPANRAVMLSTFSPVVNLLLVHMLLDHDPIKKKHVMGVGLSFIGISAFLVFREPGAGMSHSMSGSDFLGDIMMLASVFLYNIMVIFEKKALSSGGNPLQLLHATNVVSILLFALFFLLSQEKVSGVPITSQSIGAFLSLFSVAGVFLFYYRRWLVSKLHVSYMNSFSHLGKVIAVFYAVVFLGETISLMSICFFGVILSGTFIATRQEKVHVEEV